MGVKYATRINYFVNMKKGKKYVQYAHHQLSANMKKIKIFVKYVIKRNIVFMKKLNIYAKIAKEI
jgi:hypothetical protein